MKINICSLKDTGLKVFLQPVFDERPIETIKTIVGRTIISETRRNPDLFRKYRDNEFYCIGVFDDETGKIETLEKPILIVRCNDVLNVEEHDKAVMSAMVSNVEDIKEKVSELDLGN